MIGVLATICIILGVWHLVATLEKIERDARAERLKLLQQAFKSAELSRRELQAINILIREEIRSMERDNG